MNCWVKSLEIPRILNSGTPIPILLPYKNPQARNGMGSHYWGSLDPARRFARFMSRNLSCYSSTLKGSESKGFPLPGTLNNHINGFLVKQPFSI